MRLATERHEKELATERHGKTQTKKEMAGYRNAGMPGWRDPGETKAKAVSQGKQGQKRFHGAGGGRASYRGTLVLSVL